MKKKTVDRSAWMTPSTPLPDHKSFFEALVHEFPWGSDEPINGGDVVDWINLNLALHGKSIADYNADKSRGLSNDDYIMAAQALMTVDGEIEVDDNAVVSRGDDSGAYVQAWVWVGDSAAKDERKKRKQRRTP